MYILERLLGVGSYVFLLAVIIFLISVFHKKAWKSIFIIYLIFLVLLADLYVPAETADLYRIRLEMRLWYSGAPFLWSDFFSTSTPSAYVLFFIFSRFSDEGLLPAFSALLYYGILFYIIYSTAIRNQASKVQMIVLILSIMSMGKFLQVISGIRFYIGSALIIYCIYREFVFNVSFWKHIPLYIIGGGFHLAILAIVLLRIAFFIFQYTKKSWQRILYFFLVICFLGAMFIWGKSYLLAVFQKALNYLGKDIYSYFWEYCISLLAFITILFVEKKFFDQSKRSECRLEYRNLFRFLCCLNSLVVLFCFEYSIFMRFISISVILNIPILMKTMKLNELDLRAPNGYFVKRKSLEGILILCYIVILFIVCARGDLCGYKFFVR